MLRPKPEIAELRPGVHGGVSYLELNRLGISAEDVIDFSVSTNPFGPPDGLHEIISQASIDRYPDSEASELKRMLACTLNVKNANLVIGSGSTELIRLVTTAYLGPKDIIIIPNPTYGEYETAAVIAGARVVKFNMAETEKFYLEAADFAEMIQKHRPSGVFLCNPNNPTGQFLSQAEVEIILSASRNCLVVLDEAYVSFTENKWPSTDLINEGNLVIVRSMTKDYGLAGLRLGYAVAAAPIISTLEKIKPPWSVNTMAQAAGSYVLKAYNYLANCEAKIRDARIFLVNELQDLGFYILPSAANFFLVKVNDAAPFRQALLKKGYLVRDCSSFGLPHYIRLAARPINECRRLIAAIKEIGGSTYAG